MRENQLFTLENNHTTLLHGLLWFWRYPQLLLGPHLHDVFDIVGVACLNAFPDGFRSIRIKEGLFDSSNEAQRLVCRVLRVGEQKIRREACPLTKFQASLWCTYGDEEEFDVLSIENWLKISVELNCQFPAEGSPHGAGKREDDPIVLIPQTGHCNLKLR